MRRRLGAALALTSAAVCGCATAEFPLRQETAMLQLERAEEAGARKHDVADVEDRLGQAAALEAEARKTRSQASKDMIDAKSRLELADGRLAARQQLMQENRAEVAAVDSRIAGLRTERRQLRQKNPNLSGPEVERLLGGSMLAAAQQRQSLHLVRQTLEKQLELARVQRDEARARLDAEEARLRAADLMFEVAGKLYDQAEAQASALEAKALVGQQQAIETRFEGLEEQDRLRLEQEPKDVERREAREPAEDHRP